MHEAACSEYSSDWRYPWLTVAPSKLLNEHRAFKQKATQVQCSLGLVRTSIRSCTTYLNESANKHIYIYIYITIHTYSPSPIALQDQVVMHIPVRINQVLNFSTSPRNLAKSDGILWTGDDACGHVQRFSTPAHDFQRHDPTPRTQRQDLILLGS